MKSRRHWTWGFPGIAVVVFLAVVPRLGQAQTVPKITTPPARSIVLPPNLVAGAPATLAVLDAAGRLVPKVTVELSNGDRVVTDVTGRALFKTPPDPGVFTARISARNITASSKIVEGQNPSSPAPDGSSDALQILSYPRFLSLHDRFAIDGRGFLGAADSNRIALGTEECLVLASSPVSLIVLPGPRTPIGAMSLHVSTSGNEAKPNPVNVVLLEARGPTDAIYAGAQGVLTVQVRGTDEPVSVEVRNYSPAIIQLIGGNVQRVTTSGGVRNTAQIEMKYLAVGDYTVTTRLIPPVRGELGQILDRRPAPGFTSLLRPARIPQNEDRAERNVDDTRWFLSATPAVVESPARAPIAD